MFIFNKIGINFHGNESKVFLYINYKNIILFKSKLILFELQF